MFTITKHYKQLANATQYFTSLLLYYAKVYYQLAHNNILPTTYVYLFIWLHIHMLVYANSSPLATTTPHTKQHYNNTYHNQHPHPYPPPYPRDQRRTPPE